MPHSQSPDVSSPQLPSRSKPVARQSNRQGNEPRKKRRPSRTPENSEVLVSAVISTYLLTHLHHCSNALNTAPFKTDAAHKPLITLSCAKCFAWKPAAWKTPQPLGSKQRSSTKLHR